MPESTIDKISATPSVMTDDSHPISDPTKAFANSGDSAGPNINSLENEDGKENQHEENFIQTQTFNSPSPKAHVPLVKPDNKISRSAEFETRDADQEGVEFLWKDEEALNATMETAPKQFWQVLEYAKIMEDRVSSLELKVKALQVDKNFTAEAALRNKRSDSSPSGMPSVLPEDGFDLKLELRRVSRREFGECVSNSVIDVLYGDTEDTPAPYQSNSDGQALPASVSTTANRSNDHIAQDSETYPKGQRPSRVKINSRRLRHALALLTGQNLRRNSRQILAPFKLFAQYEREIRLHEKTLEEQSKILTEAAGTEAVAAIPAKFHPSRDECKIPDLSLPDDPAALNQTPKKSTGPNTADATVSPTDAGVQSHSAIDKDGDEESNDSDEVDDSAYPNGDIFEIMELYQVTRKQAGKALVDTDGHVNNAIAALGSKLSKEAKRAAAATYSTILLPEWRILLKFMDEDLKVTLAVCSQIRAGTLKRIAFEDLHHLFAAGDTVFAPTLINKRLEAYRVLGVQGGRKLLDQATLDEDHDRTAPENLEKALENLLHAQTRYSTFIVDCCYYAFNGRHFGASSAYIRIPKYDGSELITSLPVFPAKFRSDGVDWRSILISRGEKYAQICSLNKAVHKQYLGLTLDESPEEVDSRVIVDFVTGLTSKGSQQPSNKNDLNWDIDLGIGDLSEPHIGELEEPLSVANSKASCNINSCIVCDQRRPVAPIFNDQVLGKKQTKTFVEESPLITKEKLIDKDLGPEELLLLPFTLPGFVLRSRKWAVLDIDKITDVNMDKANFDNLVLPAGHADIVRALVETHFQDSNPETAKSEIRPEVDLVRGKGKGLIVLLHGAPGVGKTSTAECVAEYTQRPLYALTCGDVGETASKVEENLDRCFRLAHTWGCILLLDEADVFLAKRDKTDLKRNALVSVFLRTLEYYAGILFLTTNRVATFDDAFKSRIHMSLYYPALSSSSTKQVWQMNIKRTLENVETVKMDEDEIVQFGMTHYKKAKKTNSGKWNGRQIRNAFQTAIALAEWEVKQGKVGQARLTKAHFQKVAEASRAFDEYLNDVFTMDEEARASTDRIRADWATPSKPTKSSSKSESNPSKSAKSGKKNGTKGKRKKSKKYSESNEASEAASTSAESTSGESSS